MGFPLIDFAGSLAAGLLGDLSEGERAGKFSGHSLRAARSGWSGGRQDPQRAYGVCKHPGDSRVAGARKIGLRPGRSLRPRSQINSYIAIAKSSNVSTVGLCSSTANSTAFELLPLPSASYHNVPLVWL